ncbi:hypothetical protein [[Mycobacterium] fortunisiensis]|nr:hypothetical protein [[Mycobacterium] fortunisiensis]
MADKSHGRAMKKSATTLKERRAAKREKELESKAMNPRRKRVDRG